MITKYSKLSTYGKEIYYEILENGFKIYVGQAVSPSIHQYEPYIPDPSKSYEENAKDMCEELCKEYVQPDPQFILTENMYMEMQSNIDYLMLINDSTIDE